MCLLERNVQHFIPFRLTEFFEIRFGREGSPKPNVLYNAFKPTFLEGRAIEIDAPQLALYEVGVYELGAYKDRSLKSAFFEDAIDKPGSFISNSPKPEIATREYTIPEHISVIGEVLKTCFFKKAILKSIALEPGRTEVAVGKINIPSHHPRYPHLLGRTTSKVD